MKMASLKSLPFSPAVCGHWTPSVFRHLNSALTISVCIIFSLYNEHVVKLLFKLFLFYNEHSVVDWFFLLRLDCF